MRSEAMRQVVSELDIELLNSPSVVSFTYGTDTTALRIWMEKGSSPRTISGPVKKLVRTGFRVDIRFTGYSKGDYVAVRRALSKHLFGIDTNVDVSGRFIESIKLTKANRRVGNVAVTYVLTLRKQGIEVFDTYMPGDDPTIELQVSPDGVEAAQGILPPALRGLVTVTRGGRVLQ